MAEVIRKAIDLYESERSSGRAVDLSQEVEWEFAEGRLLTFIHLRRERNPKACQALTADQKRTGRLARDLCQWSFDRVSPSTTEDRSAIIIR